MLSQREQNLHRELVDRLGIKWGDFSLTLSKEGWVHVVAPTEKLLVALETYILKNRTRLGIGTWFADGGEMHLQATFNIGCFDAWSCNWFSELAT